MQPASDSKVGTAGSNLEQHRHAPHDSASAHRLRADIDLSAIADNVRSIKSVVGSRCRVMAVVKANGYGLGAPWVAAAALEGGASMLAVACVDEGVALRRAGYNGPILVMSYAAPDEAVVLVKNKLTPALHRPHTAEALERAAAASDLPHRSVAVHIKVDTGLGRYGCLPGEFLPLAEYILGLPHLRLEGLMTHFADADSTDLSFAREQLERFSWVRRQAEEHSIAFDLVHAANSAATLALPESHFDMVRVGIMLSGHLPSPSMQGKLPLRRALTLSTRLARVYAAEVGSTVGYGRTWTAARPSLIGLIPVGYADGYSRTLSNRAEVLVCGRRAPVVGRISMDQAGLDLTDVPEAVEGAEVVLIGKQGDQEITADEIAGWAGTISYEVLCALSERVPRHYYQNGESVNVRNLLGHRPTRPRTPAGSGMSR